MRECGTRKLQALMELELREEVGAMSGDKQSRCDGEQVVGDVWKGDLTKGDRRTLPKRRMCRVCGDTRGGCGEQEDTAGEGCEVRRTCSR
jgi:hypothetical protein